MTGTPVVYLLLRQSRFFNRFTISFARSPILGGG